MAENKGTILLMSNEQNKAPDNRSVFEDSILTCCPEDPSTLKASIIFGEFLKNQNHIKTCNQMHKLPKLKFPINKLD